MRRGMSTPRRRTRLTSPSRASSIPPNWPAVFSSANGWSISGPVPRFAAGHLPGALSFELSDDFATYLGRLYDWGAPLTLIAESRAQLADARRQLMRVGIHRINGAALGRPEELTDGRPVASYPVTDFAGLARAMAAGTPTVLDVRGPDERAAGGVRDSLHVPVDRLRVRLREVPHGEVWVCSGSGYRASIAASILARAEYHPILVDGPYDDPDTGAAAVGLHTPPFPSDPTMEEDATDV
jgi:hydroxyacylglutathione hydrolase